MDNTLFLTGNAGTGKSYVLNAARSYMSSIGLKYVVLSTTGRSALLVDGQTIHYFFGFKTTSFEITRNKKTIKKLDLIVIDEVSMLSAFLLDMIDKGLRSIRGNNKPFGGIKMVFTGDLFQLPPVIKDSEREIHSRYDTPYFFSAPVFDDFSSFEKVKKPLLLSLTDTHRQKDPELVSCLNEIRSGSISIKSLDLLNSRVSECPEGTIYLTPTNAKANFINETESAKNPNKEIIFRAVITGKFDEASYPTEKLLSLKVGSRVIAIRNDPSGRYYNGSLGVIIYISKEGVGVSFDGSDNIVTVGISSWQKVEYKMIDDAPTALVVGTFSQIPLRQAYSITIHKSQGCTFDRVHVDIGGLRSRHGVLYVALSRCVSIDGLTLESPLVKDDVKTDSRVLEVFNIFSPASEHWKIVSSDVKSILNNNPQNKKALSNNERLRIERFRDVKYDNNR